MGAPDEGNMLELDPQTTAVLALAACAAVLVLAILLVVVALRVRRLGREHRRAFDRASGEDVVGALGRHNEELDALRRSVHDVDVRTGEVRELLRDSVSRVGTVRYDAFEDMGGALSFSSALLDERGNGLVISAINGRTETRCYAKPVAGGLSEHNLSREEQAAIDTAVAGGGVGEAPPAERRRRRSS
ncbi:DUF4446 family protein [Nitriliruptoraceae bacterium ZYF776]|nr:DUF4446 family protein [Profundirhabdus halotolerans]